MKIACVAIKEEAAQAELRQELREGDELRVFSSYEELAADPFAEKTDAMIGEPPIELIRRLPCLRWVQLTWAGANMYTMGQGFPAHVTLTNASGAFGAAISEYVLAGVLALKRRMFTYRAQMQQGMWLPAPGEQTLEGGRALILGTGDIGRETAKKLRAFGMHVSGVRRTAAKALPEFERVYTTDQLPQALPEADLVVGALPETALTKGLLTAALLRVMKRDAFFVNVGRGSLVSADDLSEVLAEGRLSGLLLDVTDPEPLPPSHPLWKNERVLITPHISGRSWGDIAQTRMRIVSICRENVRRFLSDKPLLHVVDMERAY